MIDKIKVSGITYSIVFPYKFTENRSYLGLHKAYRCKIYISDESQGIKRNTQMIYRTLLHELFHAIDFHYCGCVMEEENIDKLANAWFLLIKSNNLFMENKIYKVNIFGIDYSIKYDYKFEDIEASYLANDEDLKIRICSGNSQFERLCVIKAVNRLIANDLDIDLEECETFGNGIYQVFKDSRLDIDIRNNYI